MDFTKTTLNGGLRIITVPLPTAASVTLGFYVATGSRYEPKEVSGLSHFLEHMLFKGSQNYPTAKDIFGAVERLGGVLNGWTDVEATAYWVRVPADQLEKALAVLADLVFHPLFDKEELEKERQVVLEEIARRNDHPEELSFELLGETLWPNQALGRWVLGKKGSLAAIDRGVMQSYWQGQYTAGNMVFGAAGALAEETLLELLRQQLPPRPAVAALAWEKAVEKQDKPRLSLLTKKTDQAHLCLGFPSLPNHHPQRFTLEVLSAILGEGAASRLFQNIREKMGLAYSVGSDVAFLRDTGEVVVHAGLNTGKLALAVKEILREVKRMKDEAVKVDELNLAKAMLKGHLLLGLEDTHSALDFFARQELLVGEVLRPEEVVAKLAAVTREEVQALAAQIFTPAHLNLALVGPYGEKDRQRLQSLVDGFS